MIISSATFLIRTGIPLFVELLALAISLEGAGAQQNSILTYHGDASRSGNFVVPALPGRRRGPCGWIPVSTPALPATSMLSRSIGMLQVRMQRCCWWLLRTTSFKLSMRQPARNCGDGRSGIRLRVRCCLAAISIHLASLGRQSSIPQPKRSILTRRWSGQTDLAAKFLGYR
jgi:hypothetical protein